MRPEHYDLDIDLDVEAGVLAGRVRLRVRNDADTPVTEVSLLLNRLLRVTGCSATLTQQVRPVLGFEAQLVNHVRIVLPTPVAQGGAASLDIEIEGELGDYVDTGMLYVRDRLSPGYTILRPDAFAYPIVGEPSQSNLRAAGLPEFTWEARITVPATHQVACGGELLGRGPEAGRTRFAFRSIRPSWRMDFAIARYETLSRGRLRVHHFPEDAAGASEVMDGLEFAFRTYEAWFGPLRDEPTFAVIEIPDGWGSQAVATCILQTAAAFRDPTRMVEVYHEVSHLWNVPATDHPSPRLSEGLAMFLQYRMADERDGSASLAAAIERVTAELRRRFDHEPQLRRIPMVRYGIEGRTDLSYSVGMLMFAELFRRVGAATFDRLIGGFYQEFVDRGAATSDFTRYAVDLAGADLGPFFETWLEKTGWQEAVLA